MKEQKCFGCEQGVDVMMKRDEQGMKKFGWVAHYVFDDPGYPNRANYHTHGVQESFGHKDFQVCLPLRQETVHSTITTLVGRVKRGKVYEAGQKVSRVIKGMKITFKDAVENGRPVLRVIFPDATGCLERDEMDEGFSNQWE